ncbi:hypothetical protein DITRI_Ditri05aG0164400 [Diplodiscus trichospermus]
MGIVQGKNSMNSHPGGLEKLKMENGYLGKGGFVGHRRSTGQRYSEREGNFNGKEKERSNGTVGKRNFLVVGDEMIDGWPKWLVDNIPKEVLAGLVPKSAESYDKLDKIGEGTYSNVYKARDRETGKIVALKKVRFETSEPECEIYGTRDHDIAESDLARIISRPEGRLTKPQIKCYMHQLLSGLQHCHESGILHWDIKGAPELLLGSTDYGVGIDIWSAGCLLAEMFAGRPIMPGRTEVAQLHKIFKLCGTPSEEYWKKLRLSTTFRPHHSYKPSLVDDFRNFPKSSLGLLSTLLALDPAYRGSASSALQNEFFYTSPLACDLSGLPVVYNKDDEANEQRKKQDGVIEQKEETTFHREDTKKTTEPHVELQEPGSSTTSTSSGSKPTQVEIPSLFLSPVSSSGQKTSPSTHFHAGASRNIRNRPPLPSSQTRAPNYQDNGNMCRLNQVSRSASTREFRTLNQKKHLEYASDD